MADVVDASIVFVPKFSTLVGAGEFTTLALDVSQFAGAQFQIWRGPFHHRDGVAEPKFEVYLEESLDTETWALGPNTPTPFEIAADEPKLFSYGFRLRWFRLRIKITEEATSDAIVTCWAEGLLRGGGGGVWGAAQPAPAAAGARRVARVGGRSNPNLGVDLGNLGQPVKPPPIGSSMGLGNSLLDQIRAASDQPRITAGPP